MTDPYAQYSQQNQSYGYGQGQQQTYGGYGQQQQSSGHQQQQSYGGQAQQQQQQAAPSTQQQQSYGGYGQQAQTEYGQSQYDQYSYDQSAYTQQPQQAATQTQTQIAQQPAQQQYNGHYAAFAPTTQHQQPNSNGVAATSGYTPAASPAATAPNSNYANYAAATNANTNTGANAAATNQNASGGSQNYNSGSQNYNSGSQNYSYAGYGQQQQQQQQQQQSSTQQGQGQTSNTTTGYAGYQTAASPPNSNYASFMIPPANSPNSAGGQSFSGASTNTGGATSYGGYSYNPSSGNTTASTAPTAPAPTYASVPASNYSPNTTASSTPTAATSTPSPSAAPLKTGPAPSSSGAGGLSYNPYFYKVVILGEGGVGKSALTIMFVQNLFIHDYDPTIENSYKKQVEVDGRLVTIDILDTAGQEEYIAMRDQHIRRGQGFLIVYSIAQKSSFTGVNAIHTQIQRVKDDDHPPCVLVGNKKDLVDSRQVSTSEGQNLANSLAIQFVESSVKLKENVIESFQVLVREIDRHHTANSQTGDNTAGTGGGEKKKRRFCTLL